MIDSLIPSFIQTHHQHGQTAGAFAAVSLFIDISGFTTLTETLMRQQKDGAEALTAALNQTFQPLVSAVYHNGGFIATFAGDAFTALFPLEQDHPRVALHAARVACLIQRHFAEQEAITTPYGSFTLGVKVGIGCGQVAWGILGTPRPNDAESATHTFFFRGTALDTCIQAEHHARQGDVVAAAAVLPLPGAQTEPIPETACARLVKLPAVRLAALPTLPALVNGSAPPDSIGSAPQTVLRTFVPDAVLDLVASGLRGEFRWVAPIFIAFDPPPDEAALQNFIATVLDLVAIYDGYCNKLDFGDKGSVLLVLFGAPVAHENDIERAADFLLALAEQPAAPPWRAGLAVGMVYAGLLGGVERCEYTAIGDVVNLAARMQAKAPWGSIWLSPPAARLLRRRGYSVEAMGAFAFKGKSSNVAVARLVGRRPANRQPFAAGPLVGRAPELARLAQCLAPILQGQFAGMTIISGEAGMGKSHLAYELRRHLEADRPITWLIGATDPIVPESLGPLKHLLRTYFAQQPDHLPEQNQARFNILLDMLVAATRPTSAAIADELERTRSFLGALVGLHWSGSLYEQVEPKLRFENTLQGLVALLQAESLQQPVVLQLEDLHWLDSDTHELLQMVSRTMHGYPFALLATSRYRDDGSPVPLALSEQTRRHLLDLGALAADEVRAQATNVLGGPVADELVAFLAEKTSGNPFFVEQLVQDMRERGTLVQQPGGTWEQDDQETATLPTTINAVLVARLDRLSAPVRQIVQTAAVLGREFELPVLVQMLQGDAQATRKIAVAASQGIWTLIGEGRYRFEHALLRDAAYDMQLRARLRGLHVEAGAAIATVHTAQPEPYYASLAYHAGKAGDQAREFRYARLAGEWSAGRSANEEALTYLTRALVLAEAHAPDSRYELLRTREQVYDRQGKRTEQAGDLGQLAALVTTMDAPAWRAEVALRQAHYANVTGAYGAAIAAAQQAIGLALAVERPNLAAVGHLHQGEAHVFQGDYAAAYQQLDQALDLARATDQAATAAASLCLLGRTAYMQAEYETALRWGRQALALYGVLDDPQGQAATLKVLGSVALEQGDYAAATDAYTRVLETFRTIGDRYNEGIALHNLGLTSHRQDDFATAIAYYQQEIAICQAIDDQQGQAIALNSLGSASIDQGIYDTATLCHLQALLICQVIGDQASAGFALENLGALAFYQGDYRTAAWYYQQSLQMREAIGDQWGLGRVHALWGLNAYHQADYQTASRFLQQALDLFRTSGQRYDHANTLIYLGILLQGVQQQTEAIAAFAQARTLLAELGRTNQAMVALAMLATLALAQGDQAQALAWVDTVVAHLDQAPLLPGTTEPFRVYLACYQVLAASNDPRAAPLLQRACALLHERAATIQDDRLRHSFLERVPHHRGLLAAWQPATPDLRQAPTAE